MRKKNDERRHAAPRTINGNEAAADAASPSSNTDRSDIDADIRRRAYERYLSRGDGPGSDVEDWCAAEREVYEAQRATSFSIRVERIRTTHAASTEEPRATRGRRGVGRGATRAGTDSDRGQL